MRIGLVGAGPWARRVHAPALAAHPGVEFAGVWARRPEAAAELTAVHGGRPFAELDELLTAADAVAFAVPPGVQAELAPRVAAAGRHVILDKPLADSLPDAEKAAAAIEEAGVYSTSMLTLRFDTGVREWLAGLPAGPAGPDTVASARWLSGALLGGPYAASSWRAEHGALLDVGPHLIDLLAAALGDVVDVEWAHHSEHDVWRLGLLHSGGARSTVVAALRLPVDPTAFEVTAFGSIGRHVLATRPADAAACYAVLLDEFLAAVAAGELAGPQSARRLLTLQRVIDQARRLAG